jgi:hypothetical protein
MRAAWKLMQACGPGVTTGVGRFTLLVLGGVGRLAHGTNVSVGRRTLPATLSTGCKAGCLAENVGGVV